MYNALVILFLGLCPFASAADPVSPLAQANAAYDQREDLGKAKEAFAAYEQTAATDKANAVEALWRAARTAWWLGEHTDKRADRLALYQQGIDDAQKAIAVNPDCVEAHFWLGANEGAFGDTKGVMKSLSLVKPIRREMAEVIRLNDRFNGGAAYHVLGVVDYKVPGLMGGSKSRAKQELEKALSIDPKDPFAHYYLAEYYSIMGDKPNKQAELAALRTLQVAPENAPELRMLQARAAKVLEKE